MGSTTWQCGVYGGEFSPIGLRLFAWWKKNGERRFQKLGSGSAGIRSETPRRCGPFIGFRALAYLQNHFAYFFDRYISLYVKYTMVKNSRRLDWCFTGKLDRSLSIQTREQAAVCEQVARGAGPLAKSPPDQAYGSESAQPSKCKPTRAASQRARRFALASLDRASKAFLAAAPLPPFFSSFIYLFLLNKYCLILINSYN
jgi:hypothetical protein